MTPRFTLLIIAGIVVYVSLSLYHWQQVKKIPGAEPQKTVHSVLSGDSQEKNWIQVSTSPGHSDESAANSAQPVSGSQVEQNSEQPEGPAADSLLPSPLPTENTIVTPPPPEPQVFQEENNELRQTLQRERSINQEQAREINDLNARITALQSALKESAARQEQRNADPVETVAEQKQIKALKTFLASKADALAKANERIVGLADKLDQTRRTLTETENENTSLQSFLSAAESAKVKAQQKADRLNDKLIQIMEEREKYLAETGRLHSELQQTKSRLTRLKSELNKARLTSEAMLRYGKEQTELITPFRQQIEVSNARAEDKNSELLLAEEDIQHLREQQQLLQNTIQTLELELRKSAVIGDKLRETSQALDKVETHSAELTAQLKVLADQLNDRDAEIADLTKTLDEAKSAAQDAAQQSDRLQKESELQQQERDSAKQELASLMQQRDATLARQQEMEGELDAIRDKNAQLRRKIEEQDDLLKAAGANAEQLTSRLQETAEQLIAAEDALQKSTTERRKLQPAQQPTAQKNSTEADKTIRQLQSDLHVAQSRLAATEDELQSLKKSLTQDESKQTDETAIAELRLERKQLRQSLADQELQLKKMEQAFSELQNENRHLQEQIKTAEQDNRSRTELESLLEQKNKEINERKDRIPLLENEITDLQSELDRRETAFFNMQEEYTALQDQIDSLQRERDTFFPYTVDSDNDSISDAKDNCPDTAPGADVGPDGCEQDSDQDGVVDRLDLCPDAPEVADINSLGCTRGENILLSGIFFSGGNAELSPASQAYLDKVADVLNLFADHRFEVAGHTDSIGEPDRNLTVSRQRAESVTNYLVSKGVKADHLTPAGYGSEQPVADNTTPEGRARNRRVELRILQPEEDSAPVKEDMPLRTAE